RTEQEKEDEEETIEDEEEDDEEKEEEEEENVDEKEKEEEDEEVETSEKTVEETEEEEKEEEKNEEGSGEGAEVAEVIEEKKEEEPEESLIPLDALGDRDEFVRPTRRIRIAPNASLATSRLRTDNDLKRAGKNKDIRMALGYMQLWKKAHCSNEDSRGIVVDEPLDVEGDLLRARRRDTMIEKTFNKMKKKNEHDRLREKLKEEIREKMKKEKEEKEKKDAECDKEEVENSEERDDNGKKDEEKTEEKKEVEDAEKEEGEKEDEEKEKKDAEKARIMKENDEILRLAIAKVDEKLQKSVKTGEKHKTFFAVPGSSSVGVSAILQSITEDKERNLEEAKARKMLRKLIGAQEVDSGEKKKKSKKGEESEESEEEEDEDIELDEEIIKVTATKKSAREISAQQLESRVSSFHETEVLDLLGVRFAECDNDKLMPVATLEEQDEAEESRVDILSKTAVKKAEDGLRMEQRYRGKDALPRAITRFRRSEAIDSALLRESAISSQADSDLVTMEHQVIGFLTDSIHNTKREALLEKQMVDLEKNTDEIARSSSSPIMFYKRDPNTKSILGAHSIDYNARERWSKREDASSIAVGHKQGHLVRQQHERINEQRRKIFDGEAEAAITRLEPRVELPCPTKERQDLAKEKIMDRYCSQTRAHLLQAYSRFFDDEGRELNETERKGGDKVQWLRDQLSASNNRTRMNAREKMKKRKKNRDRLKAETSLNPLEKALTIVEYVKKTGVDVNKITRRENESSVPSLFDQLKDLNLKELEQKKEVEKTSSKPPLTIEEIDKRWAEEDEEEEEIKEETKEEEADTSMESVHTAGEDHDYLAERPKSSAVKEKEEKEAESPTTYVNHVVNMTRGGKTVSKVVRRPSNASLLMRNDAKVGNEKEDGKEEEKIVYTKMGEDGKLVKYVKIKKDKKKLNEDEKYQEMCKKHTVRHVTFAENHLDFVNPRKAASQLRKMEAESEMYRRIGRRMEKSEMTEEDKEELEDMIRDELEEEIFGPSTSGSKSDVKEEPEDPDLPITDAERRGALPTMEKGENAETKKEEEEEDENKKRERIPTMFPYTIERKGSYDVSKLRPFRNLKVCDTAEDIADFPWMTDDYDSISISKEERKLVELRTKLRRKMKEKADEEMERIRVPRFKLKSDENEKYISPFSSVWKDKLPSGLVNDLNIFRLIVRMSLNDDTISSEELAILRKKVNLSKRGFSEAIRTQMNQPPKAFKSLVQYAIECGERQVQREHDIAKIAKWQERIDARKIRRSRRKALLKRVKVTRRKYNARLGRKLRRTDWTLGDELKERLREKKLLPEERMKELISSRQMTHEMRRLNGMYEEDHRIHGEERREKDADEKEKEEEKRKRKMEETMSSALGRMAAGTSWDSPQMAGQSDTLEGVLSLFDDESDHSTSGSSSDSTSLPPSPYETESQREKRKARERSWTYSNDSDESDESFIDYGHDHWIGEQVHPPREITASPISPDEANPTVDGVPSQGEQLADALTSTPVPAVTPAKQEEQPRPFLTLAQRKAYFTEENEEDRKKKEEEEAKKRAEEEEAKKKEEKEKEELAEQKKKEDEVRRANYERIKEKKRLKEIIKMKSEMKYNRIMDEIDEDTREKQLKMFIDALMTSYRRSDAIQFILQSADEMAFSESRLKREIKEWEETAEMKRLSTTSHKYVSFKSLFEGKGMTVLRKGVKVERKRDAMSSLPDSILIEDLLDSMCTFIAGHVDEESVLSQLRMASGEQVNIRTVAPLSEKDEMLVKKSLAAVSAEEEEMVERTLRDTPYNTLSFIGSTVDGDILSATRDSISALDDATEDLRRKERAEVEAEIEEAAEELDDPNFKRPHLRRRNTADFDSVKEELRRRLGLTCLADVDSIEEAIIDDALARETTPDLEAVLDFAVEERAAPIFPRKAKTSNASAKRVSMSCGSGLISTSVLREISDQLKTVEKKAIEIKQEMIEEGEERIPSMTNDETDEKPEKEALLIASIDNKNLQEQFDGMRTIIDAARDEFERNLGEVCDEDSISKYLREDIWKDSNRSSKFQSLIDDAKKRKEKERRSLIDMGDITPRVFDLSATGQLERWVDDVFYVSPVSEAGKKMMKKMVARVNSRLHCQLALRKGEDGTKRIHPEIVMTWTFYETERSEVVHKCSPIPAHQWDSIEKLIKMAVKEKEEEGILSSDDEQKS
ncbi:hypothetical protein PFISCL1PPCAC_27125, partial [Pristionchus fissidentatus]